MTLSEKWLLYGELRLHPVTVASSKPGRPPAEQWLFFIDHRRFLPDECIWGQIRLPFDRSRLIRLQCQYGRDETWILHQSDTWEPPVTQAGHFYLGQGRHQNEPIACPPLSLRIKLEIAGKTRAHQRYLDMDEYFIS